MSTSYQTTKTGIMDTNGILDLVFKILKPRFIIITQFNTSKIFALT